MAEGYLILHVLTGLGTNPFWTVMPILVGIHSLMQNCGFCFTYPRRTYWIPVSTGMTSYFVQETHGLMVLRVGNYLGKNSVGCPGHIDEMED